MNGEEKLYIIDSISPFFVRHKKEKRINWSKVPYHRLEKNGRIKKKTFRQIADRFERYVRRIVRYGYTAISIDELCYLVNLACYPPEVDKKLKRYRKYLGKLFDIAKAYSLKIFITTDIMFTNEYIERSVKDDLSSRLRLFGLCVEKALDDFPQIDGIIYRIGESDGIDVKGFFHSKILIRTPEQARRLILDTLPAFESRGKLLIFRTWTTGAYDVGDLLWNRHTFKRIFRGIRSDYLVVSMKYGETDYFRYLDPAPHFRTSEIRFILELQTRREYEGFGMFPSFIGWYYRGFYRKLKDDPRLAGIHVWCQTGGWSGFKNLTFVRRSSIWNELNTWVAIRMFRHGWSLRRCVKAFFPKKKTDEVLEFLKISEILVRRVLYIPAFASRPWYAYRVRIPPLLHFSWDHLTATDLIRRLYLALSANGAAHGGGVEHDQTAYPTPEAFESYIVELDRLRRRLNFKYDFGFHRDLFRILHAVGLELTRPDSDPFDPARIEALQTAAEAFRKRYGSLIKFKIHLTGRSESRILRTFLRLCARRRRSYRLLDRLLFNRLTIRLYLLVFHLNRKRLPAFINRQAMPIRILLS